MIKLYYQIADTSTWRELDVDQNEVIRVTKQVLDYKDPSKRRSDLSKSFKLPFSEVNTQFFGSFFDPSFESSIYSPYVEIPVLVYDDTDIIFRGNMALEGIDRESPGYRVRVFGRLNTLKNTLGESLLKDLDWTEYDHVFSESNISDSWSGILEVLDGSTTDVILYPFSDWGKGYGFNGYDITSNQNPVFANDFYPSMNFKTMIESIFTKNGLVLDLSDFNYPDFDKIFYQLFVEKEKSIGARDFFFAADMRGGTSMFVLDGATDTEVMNYLSTSNQSGVFEDNQNAFVCSANGNYDLSYDASGEWASEGLGAGLLTVETQFFKNGSPVGSADTSIVNKIANQQGGTFDNSGTILTLALVIGDIIDIRVTVDSLNEDFSVGMINPANFQMDASPTVFLGGVLDISKTMGEIKQIDVVKAFLNQWNLIIEQDEDIEQNFKVLPFDTWMDQGAELDFTETLDVSKPVVVKPATEYMKHDIDYQLKKTSDDLNKRYLDANGRPYGAVHIDTGIAYTTGSQELFTIWAPYPTSRVTDTDIYMARYYKDQDNPSLEKIIPQLFFYNGLLDSGSDWFIDDNQGGPSTISVYPNCSNFRYNVSDKVDRTSQDLNFAFNFPFDSEFYIIESTDLTIYNQFHFGYNSRLYDLGNRILECSVFMTPALFNSIKMNEKIIVSLKGSATEYKILIIKEFPINLSDSVNIILMKS